MNTKVLIADKNHQLEAQDLTPSMVKVTFGLSLTYIFALYLKAQTEALPQSLVDFSSDQ